ncbi:MAG: hypothetical protein M3Y87_06105 [Myxococcota bacterium]|nr:hypothetical protein [Myxococcota bacterium]
MSPRPPAPDGLIERVIASLDDAHIAHAREEFSALTGSFEPGEPFYEERIRAFLDWITIERDGGAALRSFLTTERALDADDRALGRALLSSMRSLYRVSASEASSEALEGSAVIDCLLHGARFALRPDGAAARLRPGDVLDGRAIGIDGVVLLAPGPVFHPREVHEALDALLAEARDAGRCDAGILDPLLRMRMRFDRFHSIRAKHVYRFDALERTEILAAPWAGAG